MNTIEALNGGKIVFFKSNESRYYKKEDNKFFYSDNLKDWKESNIEETAFTSCEGWEILE